MSQRQKKRWWSEWRKHLSWQSSAVQRQASTETTLARQRCVRCLSRVAACVQKGGGIPSVLSESVAMLALHCQYPEYASARIELDGRFYETDAFALTDWCLSSPITVGGELRGRVEICYREACPPAYEGPFLLDERFLLDGVVSVLAIGIEWQHLRNSLCDSEQKFLAIFNNAVNGVLLAERYSKRCCMANTLFCRMLGYLPEEIPDLSLSDIQPDMPVVDQLYDPLVGQHALREQVPLIGKDRSLLYADISSFPIVVGEREYILDIFKDVTEQRWAENEQMQELSALVLMQKELAQGLRFLHGDVHTLGAEMLQEQERLVPPVGQERWETRVQKIERRLDAVLHYLEGRKGETSEIPIDLDEILLEVLAEVKLPTSIEVVIDRGLPAVLVDRQDLFDVWLHLLSNAGEAIGSGGGRIQVSAQSQSGEWQLCVADNGCGVPMEHQQAIFGLFRVVPTDQAEHLGLGLAMVRKNVTQWGGRTWIESTPGRGSRLYFSLPEEKVRQIRVGSAKLVV